jgi:Na+-driven multidrug efflux pump
VLIAFLIGFGSTALMLLLAPAVTSMVSLSPGAVTLLWGMMKVLAFYMIGRAVNTIIINGIFTAGGDTLYDMYSLAVCMWGIAVPLAAAGTFLLNWPPVVVYACTCLDEVGKIPWTIIHYRKYKWIKNLTRD